MKLSSELAAVVTGGASGLGEASARALAAAGVKVALFDLSEDRGKAVAADIGGTFCRCDVSDDASVDDALARARQAHGQERILVNCAGIVSATKTAGRDRKTGSIAHHDIAAFNKVIQVNLVGTFRMCAKSAAGMMATEPVNADGARGVMINTASVAAVEGQVGQVAYSASKGGVLGMMLPMARDLAREGIRVVSIMPGLFHTPMFDSLTEEVRQSLAAQVPFPSRLGRPEEYAALVRHICENDMLNGEQIRLDGAIRMQPK